MSRPGPFIFPTVNFSSFFRPLWSQFASALRKYLRALYLFTHSDQKTVLIPVTIFAYFSAPDTNVHRMAYCVFWTWLHLLQTCVSNQSLDFEEDALNKPWRPVPSGLISVSGARVLRWILLPSCLFLSVYLQAHGHSISLALATLVYNELHFHSHGLMRNVCSAWGYASFNAGAAMIAAGQSTLTTRTAISVTINTLITLSTIHSQDFRDQVGDKRVGRWTIPMAWPTGSRISILVILTAWSVGLSWACGLVYHFSVPFCMLAVFIGLRFVRKHTIDEDRLSYRYYNIWLVAAQAMHTPTVMTVLSRL